MTHDTGNGPEFLSVRRSDALADGIYAVAMTLLVIELKVPDVAALHGSHDVATELLALLPKAGAWALSFFVLGLFWVGHHRVFDHVRRVDGTLTAWSLAQLALVSLMPFSSALIGEAGSLIAQVVYSSNMALLAVTALVLARHVFRHPELTRMPLPAAKYHGMLLRIGAVIAVSVVALLLAALLPESRIGNLAFILMAVVNPMSRVLERREHAASLAAPSPGGPPIDASTSPP